SKGTSEKPKQKVKDEIPSIPLRSIQTESKLIMISGGSLVIYRGAKRMNGEEERIFKDSSIRFILPIEKRLGRETSYFIAIADRRVAIFRLREEGTCGAKFEFDYEIIDHGKITEIWMGKVENKKIFRVRLTIPLVFQVDGMRKVEFTIDYDTEEKKLPFSSPLIEKFEQKDGDGELVSADAELPEGVTTLDTLQKLTEAVDPVKYNLAHPFWEKVCFYFGDITKIQVDAIVNAANDRLGGGGGVDGAIHRAAGYNLLQAECRKHPRPVAVGDAVMTDSCKLSDYVKKIIHCVGPICHGGVTEDKRHQLESCYRKALQLSEKNGLRSIVFCCISTGIYGYDSRDAAKTVLRVLWKHFSKEKNAKKWDRVVLSLFTDIDKKHYKRYITELIQDPTYFDEK
ncbi:hypothetical protein PENTCL1PPCAC_20033, partial [Pristionchus entomophagus]